MTKQQLEDYKNYLEATLRLGDLTVEERKQIQEALDKVTASN
jgi:hypothetical protein